MKPQHFDWHDDAEQAGVSTKHLGTFSERQLEISMLRVAAGASARMAPRPSTQIGVVIAGTGRAGTHELRQHAAFSIEREEGALLTAVTELELLWVGLPIFAESELRQLVGAGRGEERSA
jgi:hypothetical protein